MKGKIKSLNILLIGCFLLLGTKPSYAQEVEDESEFSYSPKSEKGPSNWGKIHEEWGACNHGTMQSPIDLSDVRVRIFSKPDRKKYKPSNATLLNRGHDIQIKWEGDAGSIFINGTSYSLKSAHWHAPSEHTLDGKSYDMELHLVHVSEDSSVVNKIAVVGVFYKIANRRPDRFLTKLMPNISTIVDHNHTPVNIGVINPDDIRIRGKECFRYIGSLTVPPCTEGVIWTIKKKVRTVSSDQIKLLREAVHDYAKENVRPLQSDNKRDIYLYVRG